jgi:1-acyl-sn-glycerol-3-phosphate acyltransferase
VSPKKKTPRSKAKKSKTKKAPKKKASKKKASKKKAPKKAAPKKKASKKAAPKKAASKKTASKKAPTKKTAPSSPARPSESVRRTRSSAEAAKLPRKRKPSAKQALLAAQAAESRRIDIQAVGRVPENYVDGGMAYRLSRSAHSMPQLPTDVKSAANPGPGIAAATSSALARNRKSEKGLLSKVRGELVSIRDSNVIESTRKLGRKSSYRAWISRWRMRNRAEAVDPYGLDPVYAERLRPMLEYLYRNYWRVEATGMENIPDHGGAMLVGNHSGTLPYDGAMVMYAAKYDHPAHRTARPLVENFLFHFPFIGPALNRLGGVRACQENAERLLNDGKMTIVFPEGIKGIGKLYKDRYRLARFGRGGFIKLALRTGTPIIPTAIVGAEEIHPVVTKVTWLTKYMGIPFVPVTPTFPWLGPLGLIPLPSRWTIRFGEPINVSEEFGDDDETNRVMVTKLAERVRATIQGMVDEELARRAAEKSGR